MKRNTPLPKRVAQPYTHADHGPPLTRRDLLARGSLSFAACVAMPGALTLLARAAQGETSVPCGGGASTSKTAAFIALDLAGGGNIAGSNVWIGSRGGQEAPLPAGSYASLGVAPEKEPGKVSPDQTLGLWFHPDSRMLAGIKATAGAAVANVEGALFCSVSGDDSRTNPHNPLYWIARAGAAGSLVPLIASPDDDAGDTPRGSLGAAPRASVVAALTPSLITRTADARGLVDPGRLVQLFQQAGATGDLNEVARKVLAASRTMSEAALRSFNQKDLPSQVQELIHCGYMRGESLLAATTADSVDVTKDADVSRIFPLIATNRDEERAANVAKLVLDGYAGGGVITLGGYDYHGRGRAEQDQRDGEAGRIIGQILALAAVRSRPVMIYVYTDGGVSANGGAAPAGFYAYSADASDKSAAFSLVYQPGSGRPPRKDGSRQIGAFNASGSVDTQAAVTGDNVETLTKAVVANYLALHGRESELAKVVGDDPFGAALGKYLAFSKLA